MFLKWAVTSMFELMDQGKFNNLGGTAYFNDTIGWHDYQQRGVIDEMIDDKFSDLIGSDKPTNEFT